MTRPPPHKLPQGNFIYRTYYEGDHMVASVPRVTIPVDDRFTLADLKHSMHMEPYHVVEVPEYVEAEPAVIPSTPYTYTVSFTHGHKVKTTYIIEAIKGWVKALVRQLVTERLAMLPVRTTIKEKENFHQEYYEVTCSELGHKLVYLRFTPTPDITAYQMYMCQKATSDMLKGNAFDFLMQHDLMRFFERVETEFIEVSAPALGRMRMKR